MKKMNYQADVEKGEAIEKSVISSSLLTTENDQPLIAPSSFAT